MVLMWEWWASEIIVFSAGLLPDPELKLSAIAIYQNTNSLCFMSPMAMGAAVTTR